MLGKPLHYTVRHNTWLQDHAARHPAPQMPLLLLLSVLSFVLLPLLLLLRTASHAGPTASRAAARRSTPTQRDTVGSAACTAKA